MYCPVKKEIVIYSFADMSQSLLNKILDRKTEDSPLFEYSYPLVLTTVEHSLIFVRFYWYTDLEGINFVTFEKTL